MNFSPGPLPGSYIIDLDLLEDERGWFARYYCSEEFKHIGHTKQWVQQNHSFTSKRGTIRGMHYQEPPFGEIKMIRCISGAVYDVIVDIRNDSPTFLSWFGLELSSVNKKMLYIPQGFAHGFQALTDNCELLYHHSEFYTPHAESGIRYNDPRINISWPLQVDNVSKRDSAFPFLNENFKGFRI